MLYFCNRGRTTVNHLSTLSEAFLTFFFPCMGDYFGMSVRSSLFFFSPLSLNDLNCTLMMISWLIELNLSI